MKAHCEGREDESLHEGWGARERVAHARIPGSRNEVKQRSRRDHDDNARSNVIHPPSSARDPPHHERRVGQAGRAKEDPSKANEVERQEDTDKSRPALPSSKLPKNTT